MPKPNFFDVLRSTIETVQQKNAANPREKTADPTIFDLIKDKVLNIEKNNKAKRAAQGKSPTSILDLIRGKINEARAENEADPNIETAPGSVFDKIIKKVDQKETARPKSAFRNVIEEYNMDVSGVSADVLRKFQDSYAKDVKKLNHRYAEKMHEYINGHG